MRHLHERRGDCNGRDLCKTPAQYRAIFYALFFAALSTDAEVLFRMLLEMFVEMPEEIARDSQARSIEKRFLHAEAIS